MCGYLEWQLNVELELFTEKTQAEFGSGSVTTNVLPVASSVTPTLPKATLTAPTASSRIPQSYDSSSTMNVDAASLATILTSAGDEDHEELEFPLNSLTSSPALSAALNTPPSNADIDSPEVVSGSGVMGGVAGVPKMMATGGALAEAKHKVTLDQHGQASFAAPARWQDAVCVCNA